MKIRSVRIRNFRCFEDETITFDSHVCLLGANGAGKSTVLAALNVFFQERGSKIDVVSLTHEDFHNGNTKEPVKITITFSELSERAKEELKHYVRHDELIATVKAEFNSETGRAPIEHFGERLIFGQFAPFFEDEKNKAVRVDQLRECFKRVIDGINDILDIGDKPTKQAMHDALRQYEDNHPEKCVLEPSADLFYGSTKGRHKINQFIQWVHLPAVKEASDEAVEAGNTALGKLLQRTVRQKVDFDDDLNKLRQATRERYDDLLEKEQVALEEISSRLAGRLTTYSHPNASLEIVWLQGSEKSVVINDPKATIKAQEGPFKGSLPHFGHGLQRSFLLAILQELALIEAESDSEKELDNRPTLAFSCEEPELYQHPPQARYLNNILRELSESGGQVFLTTHSPYFVSGEGFEEIRLVRKDAMSGKSTVYNTDFGAFASRIAEIKEEAPEKPTVTCAKLHAGLQPELSEMFFCNKVILVEGIEDRAYITTTLILEGKWDEIRRAGIHIVPVGRKSGLLYTLIIAERLEIPAFIVFDADSGVKEKYKVAHEGDNRHLMKALNIEVNPFPDTVLAGETYTIWPTDIGKQVKSEFGEAWDELVQVTKQSYDLDMKNPLFIAEMLQNAWERGQKSTSLIQLVDRLIHFASG